MNSFNNVALFIKRAEEYQTKEFIMDAFMVNNIGKVRDIKFIKKHNDIGKNYNGVIVIFERWNMNRLVQSLFEQMSVSIDGTTRFYFDSIHYWIINIHRQKLPECEEFTLVDSSLPDKQRIKKLEDLVKSMSTKIYFMEGRQERSERSMMDYEEKHSRHNLCNMELRFQLEDKDMERKWAEDDLIQEIDRLKSKNQHLQCHLGLSAIDIARKDLEYENLKEEVRDYSSIVGYLENQKIEMKELLTRVLDTDPIKPVINSYIKDYLLD